MKLMGFLSDKEFRRQFVFLLLLNVIAGFLFSGFFLVKGSLYHDNMRFYSVFRDSLHSLNYFGQPQWWHPNAQEGFPAYYLSMLSSNHATPLFVVISAVVWMLGVIGIKISSYISFYIIYFGFLVPFLFTLAFWLLTREIFSRNTAIIFMIVLASLSPGVMFNMSDNFGLEQSVYAVFFALAYLRFFRRRDKFSFVFLCAALLLLAAAMNHITLFWNVIFVPLFVFVCHFFDKEPFLGSLRQTYKAVPLGYRVGCLLLTVVCALPAVIAFSHGGDIMRTTIGTRVYDYASLKPGNPLEVLSISTLGIGFDWVGNFFKVFTAEGSHLGYTYMGILTIPLVFIGLTSGQEPWRKRLALMIGFATLVVLLSGFSPLFSLLLMLQTPLRSVNHYSDCAFRLGIFFLLILAAGLGVESILRRNYFARQRLLIAFVVSALFSLGLFYYASASSNQVNHQAPMVALGFMIALMFAYGVLLFWLPRKGSEAARTKFFRYLLVLILVDLSTGVFLHMRTTIWPRAKAYPEPPISQIGTGYDERSAYINNLLILKDLKVLIESGMNYRFLPKLGYSFSATNQVSPTLAGASSNGFIKSVSLSESDRQIDPLKEFFRPPLGESDGSVTFVSLQQTYNTLRLEVEASRDALIFWRDAYSPYWQAQVNGHTAPIAKAFGAFKSVPVPAGRSTVEFSFSPGLLPWFLLLAYLVIASVIGYSFWMCYHHSRAEALSAQAPP
jgi:hypothetical protein